MTDDPRWEYRTLSIDIRGYGLEKTLNNLGSLGWELVSTLHKYSGGTHAELFFKRRLR